jgi:hypothetical protein
MANDSGVNIPSVPLRRGRPPGQLQPENMQRQYRGQRKFSVREITEALRRNFGNCYLAAKALNETERARGGTRTIDRRAVAYHVKKRPELSTVADEGRDEICDVAEQTVFQAIRDGNAALAMRYLEIQAKDRGYTRRVDLVDELMKLDLSKLTDAQTFAFFDVRKLSKKQLAALNANLDAALGSLDGPDHRSDADGFEDVNERGRAE